MNTWQAYLIKLESSTIPLPIWVIVFVWLIIYTSSLILYRKSSVLARAQNLVVMDGPLGTIRVHSMRLTVVHVLFTAAIFVYASFYGGPILAFFAGGWIATTTVSVALQVRAILFFRALSQPGAAEGSVKFSSRLADKDRAYQLFGKAVFCLILGIILANLALLGGALILSATAFGYLRKAKGKFTIDL